MKRAPFRAAGKIGTGPLLLLALALAACDHNPTESSPVGVVVRTNATEYQVSSPPRSALVTLENHTLGPVTVRRCLVMNSPVDPFGVDLAVEQEVGGAWRPVSLGFDCLSVGATRADAVLAPTEASLVLRLVVAAPGRFRVRVGYARGVNATPTDTATSAPFIFR
jgi:hypothetical protein